MATAIIQLAATDTGLTISDFTWDFCKRAGGTDVSTTGSYLTELGVGVYELVNPNVTVKTNFSMYPTADDTKRFTGYFDASTYSTTSPLNTPGYTTYLTMVNKVLKRITESEIPSDVAGSVGKAKIIGELINEAQMELWTETTNWYTLYTTRNITTVASQATYAHADDFGRTIDLCDTTSNRILVEDAMRTLDESNPDSTYTGTPTHFSMEGKYYRFYPIPDSELTIRERYWKIPGTMSADGSTTDLPLFCENFIINWALMSVLEYLNKFNEADRLRIKLYGTAGNKTESILYKCIAANKKIIDKMFRFNSTETRMGLEPPRLPAHY